MRLFLYFSIMNTRCLIVICSLSVLLACGSENRGGNSQDSARVSNREDIFRSGISGPVDVLYFKKPYTDSVRYTRFYTLAQTTDTVFFSSLSRAIQRPPEILDGPRKCLSDGKIQIPLGGDSFKVIYFSRQGTGCPYLYMIFNGSFHYFPMPEDLNRFLIELEKQAKEI